MSVVLINLKFIEVLSLADGEVIPQSRIKYIQHLEGGIVEEILIEEGETVKSNQPLVVLSKAKASSEYEEIQSRLNSIELSILRINAEKKSLIKIPLKNFFFTFQFFFRYTFNGKIFTTDIHHQIFTLKVY